MFADLRAAYDALPESTKLSLRGLMAEHSLLYSRKRIGFTDFTGTEKGASAPVLRPLVRTIPESGRESLYIASHIGRIHGLPDEEAETTMRKETLRKILGTLSSRERQVLELRYGLDGQHPRTLDEVGRTFNVTRERIRQIENQSLKKLRALADSQRLREVAA